MLFHCYSTFASQFSIVSPEQSLVYPWLQHVRAVHWEALLCLTVWANLRARRTSGWADASRLFLNDLKYTVAIVRLKGQGVINQTYTLYLVFSPRQCSVLTSLSQSAHVLYMSAFTLCLHLARSPGIHWKTGEIYVLFLSNVFLQGRARAAWWFRIWGRETLGPWAQLVMCPLAWGGAVESSCRI